MGNFHYNSRYTGRGRRNFWLLALLFFIAAVVLAVWVLRGLFPTKAPDPVPTLAPAVTDTPTPTPAPTPMRPRPEAVRGVYVSGPVAGDPYLDSILQLIDDTELNALVIDVKNDEGQVTYRSQDPVIQAAGACINFIPDLPGLVEKLKEHNVYAIARIVAFKDPILAKAQPDLTLRRTDGAAVAESGGLTWIDPFDPTGWDYLAHLALDAAAAGFDEVQFDYVRFPTGKGASDLDLGDAAGRDRSEAITGFLSHMREVLKAEGVWLSADIFGTVITNRTDAQYLGQDYTAMGGCADILCPMVYPSHYAAGAFGLEVPDAQPYDTILAAMKKSEEVLSTLPAAERPTVRPWLQAFTATWVKGHIPYGGDEVRSQIQAVYDAGYTDWLLWNAQNRYSADGLLPADAQAPPSKIRIIP